MDFTSYNKQRILIGIVVVITTFVTTMATVIMIFITTIDNKKILACNQT